MLSINAFAQDSVIDSLKLVLKNAIHDTTRIKALTELSEVCEVEDILKYAGPCVKLCEKGILLNNSTKPFYLKHLASSLNNIGFLVQQQGDISKALEYFHKSLKIQEAIGDKEGIASSLNNIGFIYNNLGDISKALVYHNKSLKLRQEIKDKKGIAYSLNNIGSIYNNQGDIPNALEHYHKSLKLYEEIKDKEGTAFSLNNIGVVYASQGDYLKALEYYNRGIKIQEEIKDKASIAVSLINIGSIYDYQGDLVKALDYYRKSLMIQEEIQDKAGMATSLNNIGLIYFKQKDFPKSLDYYHNSLKILEEINDKVGIANSLINIGGIFLGQEKLKEAFGYTQRSLVIARELGYPKNIEHAASSLKSIYKKQNKFKEALEMYELEIQMKDSINNKETKKASIKKQFQYQYEKQAAADSVKHGEEQKVKNALLTAQQAQLKQEKTKSYALYGGLALVLVFAGFMVNRFRVTHKQKQIIELKEVETQKQNVVITQQKHLVEEKHKEITDSINYAERIQRSFLATKEELDINLKEYFVLFQPKDVVSGDFYWAHTLKNGNFALVTADSTGHGVPGAIMSLLNTSALEKAAELGIHEPAEILNHTRATIIERLKKDGSVDGGKDGMDCSLISLNKEKSKLVYAAANNPIWIVRKRHCEGNSLRQYQISDEIASLPRNDENNELIELKSDKIPVGKHDRDSISFTQHEVELQKSDMIYTLTDGFPDQFGGTKGKKFMYKKLKEMLISISNLSLNEQHEFLKNSLKEWMGNTEQVDDITIIGIRV